MCMYVNHGLGMSYIMLSQNQYSENDKTSAEQTKIDRDTGNYINTSFISSQYDIS